MKNKAREWALEALAGQPEAGTVEMFVDIAMLRILADAEATKGAAPRRDAVSDPRGTGTSYNNPRSIEISDWPKGTKPDGKGGKP